MPTVRVQDADVFVHREGRGRPLLMLHGNPDSHRLWLPMIERLKAHHDCIAPDLPGFGGSAIPPTNDVTLEGFAQWVDDLVTALGIDEPLDLIVHDIGGFYGLTWAVRHPQRLNRLIITNTLLHGDYRWHFWARVWRSTLGESAMRLFDWPIVGRFAHRVTLKQGGPGLSSRQISEGFSGFHRTARAQVLRIYREADPEKFRPWTQPLLAVIKQHPTRVLWGALDPYIPRHYATSFGTGDAKLFESAGHWAVAEAPERCGILVREHLGTA